MVAPVAAATLLASARQSALADPGCPHSAASMVAPMAMARVERRSTVKSQLMISPPLPDRARG
jgi:hypothetical protein